MNTQESIDKGQVRRGVTKRIIQILITILLMGLILFLSSGDLAWGWAWLYLGIYTLGVIVNAFVLLRRNPELVAERGEPKEGVKDWDRQLTIVGALLWLLVFLVAGLDHRFGWSGGLPLWPHLLGLLMYVVGNAITMWALNTNTFFSTSVRIQEDRGHTVVNTGPYAIIRHPGYSGMFLHITGIPLMLGSLWAFIPAFLMDAISILRTLLEDQTLQEELDGYRAYSEEVRYRLMPGVW